MNICIFFLHHMKTFSVLPTQIFQSVLCGLCLGVVLPEVKLLDHTVVLFSPRLWLAVFISIHCLSK